MDWGGGGGGVCVGGHRRRQHEGRRSSRLGDDVPRAGGFPRLADETPG